MDHLGGSDFDEAVLADAVSKLGLRGLDHDDPATARGLAALRRDCIEAKEALSSDVATDITPLLPNAGQPVRLTRSEFEGLVRPALEESIHTTVRALRLAGVKNADLHAVVLVGGSSRIPLVTELLSHELAVPVAADTFPKHDIALGAARYVPPRSPAVTAVNDRPATESRPTPLGPRSDAPPEGKAEQPISSTASPTPRPPATTTPTPPPPTPPPRLPATAGGSEPAHTPPPHRTVVTGAGDRSGQPPAREILATTSNRILTSRPRPTARGPYGGSRRW